MRTENKRKTMVQKKENGVLSVPSELLLTAGIPLDCDLMIETVPGVILIGIEAPVQTVCKPYLKVFDELGIEPNEVEAYVRTAFQFMPDSLRLDLIGELSRLLQKKEG